MSLFQHPDAPRIDSLTPDAALPGGDIRIAGEHLGPIASQLPHATLGDTNATVTLSRSTEAAIRIPEGAISGDVVIHRNGSSSNPLPLRVAVPMAENLHPVTNPAVDPGGNVYATVSGTRGQTVPVSIFRIQRDFQVRPFVRDLLNATGIAFDAAGYLYCSSRAEGIVYRISPEGRISVYAEGLGIATGLAFDRDGNLYVGDRSGTIFRIAPPSGSGPATPDQIFVYATLEPSVAAYHLAFNDAGTLFVSGPTTSSNQAIHSINRDGDAGIFYRGLGRAQGMAFDTKGNLYVAASLHGKRGIVKLTPDAQPSLAISGLDLVGLAFLEDGCASLATREALYHIDLGIEGRSLL